jgi:hypothetical protein
MQDAHDSASFGERKDKGAPTPALFDKNRSAVSMPACSPRYTYGSIRSRWRSPLMDYRQRQPFQAFEQQCFQALFGLALFVVPDQLVDILADAAVASFGDLVIDEILLQAARVISRAGRGEILLE